MSYKSERDTISVLENEIIDKLQYDYIWFCNNFDKSLDFLTPTITSGDVSSSLTMRRGESIGGNKKFQKFIEKRKVEVNFQH